MATSPGILLTSRSPMINRMVLGTLKIQFGTQTCLTLLKWHLGSRAQHAPVASYSTTTITLDPWLAGKKTKPMPFTNWRSNFKRPVPLSTASLCKCTSQWVMAPVWFKAFSKTFSESVFSDSKCTLANSIYLVARGTLIIKSHMYVRSGLTLRRRLRQLCTSRLLKFAWMRKRPAPTSKSGDSAIKTAGWTSGMLKVISTHSFSTTLTILSLPAMASFKSSQAIVLQSVPHQ